MAFNKITTADTAGKGVVGLPDSPNLTTTALQRKFDELATDVIIPKYNELVDSLNGNSGAVNMGASVPTGVTASNNAQSVMDGLARYSKTLSEQDREYAGQLSDEVRIIANRAETKADTGIANAAIADATANSALSAAGVVSGRVDELNGTVEQNGSILKSIKDNAKDATYSTYSDRYYIKVSSGTTYSVYKNADVTKLFSTTGNGVPMVNAITISGVRYTNIRVDLNNKDVYLYGVNEGIESVRNYTLVSLEIPSKAQSISEAITDLRVATSDAGALSNKIEEVREIANEATTTSELAERKADQALHTIDEFIESNVYQNVRTLTGGNMRIIDTVEGDIVITDFERGKTFTVKTYGTDPSKFTSVTITPGMEAPVYGLKAYAGATNVVSSGTVTLDYPVSKDGAYAIDTTAHKLEGAIDEKVDKDTIGDAYNPNKPYIIGDRFISGNQIYKVKAPCRGVQPPNDTYYKPTTLMDELSDDGVEITQAEFDLLTEEEQNTGKYYITDSRELTVGQVQQQVTQLNNNLAQTNNNLANSKNWKRAFYSDISTTTGSMSIPTTDYSEILVIVGAKNGEQIWGGKSYVLPNAAKTGDSHIIYENEIYNAGGSLVANGIYVYLRKDHILEFSVKSKVTNPAIRVYYR